MADEIISIDDLPQSVIDAVDSDLLQVMLDSVNATASRVAPCLIETDPAPSDGQLAEARLVLIAAIIRWSQVGVGGVTQQSETLGPINRAITYDTSRIGGYNLWPSEIRRLQEVCASGPGGNAFEIDTTPVDTATNGYWSTPDQWVPITS